LLANSANVEGRGLVAVGVGFHGIHFVWVDRGLFNVSDRQ
jgi:hypothetical protein